VTASTAPTPTAAYTSPGDAFWSRGSASTSRLFLDVIERADIVPSTSASDSESEEQPSSTRLPANRNRRSGSLPLQVRDDLLQQGTELNVLTFLAKIYHLNRRGQYHLAIDEILAFFDEALLENNLAQCQQTLRELDASQLSASLIKSVLVITGKARFWLPERQAFFKRAKDHLATTRGVKDAARLLDKHA
jgi:hypothetical protein